MYNGGGALAWKSRNQAFPTDSPGAQELLVATLAYRWTLSLRMLLADLDLGVALARPTLMWTDSQILLDGTNCERLGKSSRWLSSRYAMMRFGEACGAIAPTKLAAEENVSNAMTKPEVSSLFVAHRALLLGLALAVGGDTGAGVVGPARARAGHVACCALGWGENKMNWTKATRAQPTRMAG